MIFIISTPVRVVKKFVLQYIFNKENARVMRNKKVKLAFFYLRYIVSVAIQDSY